MRTADQEEIAVLPQNTVSLREAAKRKGVTPNTVRNWILTGRLRAQRGAGGIWWIQVNDLDAIVTRAVALRDERS